MKKPVDLTVFDRKKTDGLLFCKRVYNLFNDISKGEKGRIRLRLRKGKVEKKLIEELLPIAWFVQSQYKYGRAIKVAWVDGSQNFDAEAFFSGPVFESGSLPRKVYLEATMAVHEKDHLLREHVTEHGIAHGVSGMSRDKKTGKTISVPKAYGGWQPENELADLISDRIKKKAAKRYPENTILIIQCHIAVPLLQGGWQHIVNRINGVRYEHPFHSVYLVDSSHNRNAKLLSDH